MHLAEVKTNPNNALDDLEVVRRVLAGDSDLYEVLMRRYNQRLFRVTFSILRNRSEAEDVMQEAYIKAFQKLAQFEGRAAFSTWLTKIAVYEALRRKRRRLRFVSLDTDVNVQSTWKEKMRPGRDNPEKQALQQEVRRRLEDATEQMPDAYRTIFVLREIETLSTAETAELLDISESLVKTRLHRARAWLQERILTDFRSSRAELFHFAGESCDRVVRRVLSEIVPKRSN